MYIEFKPPTISTFLAFCHYNMTVGLLACYLCSLKSHSETDEIEHKRAALSKEDNGLKINPDFESRDRDQIKKSAPWDRKELKER